MHLRTRPLTSLHVETFWVCFPKTIVFTQANKSVSGRFCHGLKHRAGNKLHIHVCDNKLMDANALALSHSTHLTFESDHDCKVFAHPQMCALFVFKKKLPFKKKCKVCIFFICIRGFISSSGRQVFFYLQGLNLSTFESEWVRSVKGQTGVFVAVFII